MTIFDSASLQKLITDTIPPDLPAGHQNALVGTVDASGAQVVVGFTKQLGATTWQVEGAYRHQWSGSNDVGAKVLVSW